MMKKVPNKRNIILLVAILIIIICKIIIFIYEKILFPKLSPKMIKQLNQINHSNLDTIDKLWFYKKQVPSAILIGTSKSGKNFQIN